MPENTLPELGDINMPPNAYVFAINIFRTLCPNCGGEHLYLTDDCEPVPFRGDLAPLHFRYAWATPGVQANGAYEKHATIRRVALSVKERAPLEADAVKDLAILVQFEGD